MRTLKRSVRNTLLHPRYFRLPLRPEGLCGNDAQSAMLSLLVQIHRQTESWDALTLDAIGEQVARVRGQSAHSLFRSLPDRVMFKGLDGLRDNGLLVEIEADTHFATQYLPTGAFFRTIRPFHIAHPRRWLRPAARDTT